MVDVSVRVGNFLEQGAMEIVAEESEGGSAWCLRELDPRPALSGAATSVAWVLPMDSVFTVRTPSVRVSKPLVFPSLRAVGHEY